MTYTPKRKPSKAEIKNALELLNRNPAMQKLIDTFDLSITEVNKTNNLKNNFMSSNSRKPATAKPSTKKPATAKKEKIFAKGIMFFAPNENAPDFVKGRLIINLGQLQDWVDQNEDKIHNHADYGNQLKLDITENDEGRLMATVNTYGLD